MIYVSMPGSKFSHIVKDLTSLGESVCFEVSKGGVESASDGGGAHHGSALLKQTDATRGRYARTAREE
jgi:hypothetical protein